MADISDVNNSVIKDLYQKLEGLDCGDPLAKSAIAKLTD